MFALCQLHFIQDNIFSFKIPYCGMSIFHLTCSLLQEDGINSGKVTSAGMYFLGFPVYRFEQNNSVSLQGYFFPSGSPLDPVLHKLQLPVSGGFCKGF
jgi:hypothetical protein